MRWAFEGKAHALMSSQLCKALKSELSAHSTHLKPVQSTLWEALACIALAGYTGLGVVRCSCELQCVGSERAI